jgi:regulator of sigma E protease
VETIYSVSWTILSFIFVLGIMIFVHELGHCMMAKFLKISVNVFSLGFGPRLFGFKSGETDYRVSLIPLGGYVRMEGEQYDDELQGHENEFLTRPKSHRLAVAAAGPAMNIILSVLLMAGIYMSGIQVPVYLSDPPEVGYIFEDSPAAEIGLAIGDTILEIDGKSVKNWEDAQITIATLPAKTIKIAYRRNTETFERIVNLDESENTGAGFLGIMPPLGSVITAVQPGPAADAGIETGDIVLSVASASKVVEDTTDILELITSSEGNPLQFTVKRGQLTLTKEVVPELREDTYKIGVGIVQTPVLETITEKYGPLTSIWKSVEKNYELTSLTFTIIGKLLTGETSIKMMSGPIEIARFSGAAAAQGATTLITFMALISLQLGIFNLLPIPVLDGGTIAMLAIETVIRRDLSLQFKERIMQIGFLLLILLMSFVIFNDITKTIG